MSDKPNVDKFVENAVGYKAGEWGDGSILDAIKQIIEMLLPFIIGCFPASAKKDFVETCQNPSGPQVRRLRARARMLARNVDNLRILERSEVARAAADAAMDTAAVMNDSELGSCFEELQA